jgi:hypothetical protein
MHEHKKRYAQNIYTAHSLAEIDLAGIHEKLNTDSFAGIRGLVDKEQLRKGILRLQKNFNPKNDNPTTGEGPKAVQDNFQKMLVGGVKKKYNNFPRFFRSFYNPIWAEDIYGLREIFKTVARVRNLLANLPSEFAIEKIEANGLWTASRIHQYPIGGGFFDAHRDTTLIDISNEKRTEFYQIILVMSEKGRDFDEGGAFVDKGNERIILEDIFELGDIIIYDGSTQHGVEEIDPHKKLVMDQATGRLAGFVSLYKAMT